jgi:hypothetical protein
MTKECMVREKSQVRKKSRGTTVATIKCGRLLFSNLLKIKVRMRALPR